jgi:predicted dithiol-disulfide oxidoreductase (DUF899 family)
VTNHAVGTREAWRDARLRLLEREKDLTRLGDELARERRELPWVQVEKPYRFETESGPKTLAELFDGRSQLLTYHFMLGPDWTAGCSGCSFLVDHVDGAIVHLNQRDVTFVAVSRAPLEAIEAYKQRMGWQFPWVSSLNSDFNFDFGVSFTDEQRASGAEYNFRLLDGSQLNDELPGLSAFALQDGDVYHTYSTYGRGGEALIGTYHILDLAPKGRDEADLAQPMAWLRRHDEYKEAATARA